MSPDVALAAVLLLGHVAADFIFQTRAMVERKAEWRVLLGHGAVVLLAQWGGLLMLAVTHEALPLGTAFAASLALALLHIAVDAWKVRSRMGRELGGFALDQGAHVLALATAWLLLRAFLGPGGAFGWAEPSLLAAVAAMVAAYAFNAVGAGAVVGLVLGRFDLRPDGAVPGLGRLIGMLERTIVLTLVLLDQWSAIGFTIAAKSVARYPEMKSSSFAEYFLVGTLTSFALAMGTGILLRWALIGLAF